MRNFSIVNSESFIIVIIYALKKVFHVNKMTRQHLLKKVLLFSLLFLLITGVGFANAQDDDNPTDDDDTTTETEDEDDDDHDLDHHRDDDGTLWIESDVMTTILHPEMPSYQFWYSTDNNGSLARFMVSYMMIVEFESKLIDEMLIGNKPLSNLSVPINLNSQVLPWNLHKTSYTASWV